MTKACKFCLAEVDSKAKKCKHCGEWLIFLNNSTIVPALFIFLAIIFGIKAWLVESSMSDIEKLIPPKETTASIQEKVHILHHSRTAARKTVAIIGEVKNQGPKLNSSVRIQVRLLDKNNKMVDLGEDAIGILGGDEVRPFKVEFNCKSEENIEYDHYEIRVMPSLY